MANSGNPTGILQGVSDSLEVIEIDMGGLYTSNMLFSVERHDIDYNSIYYTYYSGNYEYFEHNSFTNVITPIPLLGYDLFPSYPNGMFHIIQDIETECTAQDHLTEQTLTIDGINFWVSLCSYSAFGTDVQAFAVLDGLNLTVKIAAVGYSTVTRTHTFTSISSQYQYLISSANNASLNGNTMVCLICEEYALYTLQYFFCNAENSDTSFFTQIYDMTNKIGRPYGIWNWGEYLTPAKYLYISSITTHATGLITVTGETSIGKTITLTSGDITEVFTVADSGDAPFSIQIDPDLNSLAYNIASSLYTYSTLLDSYWEDANKSVLEARDNIGASNIVISTNESNFTLEQLTGYTDERFEIYAGYVAREGYEESSYSDLIYTHHEPITFMCVLDNGDYVIQSASGTYSNYKTYSNTPIKINTIVGDINNTIFENYISITEQVS